LVSLNDVGEIDFSLKSPLKRRITYSRKSEKKKVTFSESD